MEAICSELNDKDESIEIEFQPSVWKVEADQY